MKNLQSLDLSKNNLGGMLPQCLGNFRDHLILLLLGNNSFHGIIPQTYNKGSSLRMIDVSHNKLQGQLPRSLANCVMLEHLVLSNNRFNDVFPIWLGTLLELKLLAMRHNGFYGMIGRSRKNVDFPKLRILDLAYNDFTVTGAIPQRTQLTSLNVTSYDGNPWLCGDPLPKKCGNPKAPELPPSTVDEGDSSSEGIFEFDWKIVSAGCGSGLVVGVVLADVVITRRPDLFLKIVGMIRQMIRKI
ncbi:hypothetical protein ACFX1W_040630 [Malus domestica]